MFYEEYLKEVDEKVGGLLPNEDTEIVIYMYESNWSVKECSDHIKSVRTYSKKLNREN